MKRGDIAQRDTTTPAPSLLLDLMVDWANVIRTSRRAIAKLVDVAITSVRRMQATLCGFVPAHSATLPSLGRQSQRRAGAGRSRLRSPRSAPGIPARPARPADSAHADYATAAALQLAKPPRTAPRQIAEQIAERIDSPFIASAAVAGPGFVNLRATPAWYRHVVERVLEQGSRYGAGSAVHPQKIQVEYVSGNPTGPMTASTARNAAYGDSLARLFAFAGHEVQREYYFNDAGRQMDLFGAAKPGARGEEARRALPGRLRRGRREGAGPPMRTRRPTSAGAGRRHDRRHQAHSSGSGRDSTASSERPYEEGAVERAIEAVHARGHTYEKRRRRGCASDLGDDKDRAGAVRRHADLHRRRPGLHRRSSSGLHVPSTSWARSPRVHRSAQGVFDPPVTTPTGSTSSSTSS
jgi:hypothetical protein